MKALIAGAGIGGLTAALCLHKIGIDVEILERSDQTGDVGAGIQLSPNGTRILHHLGLMKELEQVAFLPDGVELRLGKSGWTVSEIPLGDSVRTRYGFPYYHIHRGDLHTLLSAAVKSQCGDVIHTSSCVADVMQHDEGVTVELADGSQTEGDLLVGCDGIHSAVRTSLLGEEKPRFTGMIAWRGLVPTKRLPENMMKPVVTSWMGAGRHVVTYYVRRGELVNFVGVVERSNWTKEGWNEKGNKEDLVKDFAGWHPSVTTLIEEMEDPYIWALFDREPLPKWTDDRATLLGDACHPMLPFMAQGGVMAIEDAYVLSACLKTHGTNLTHALSRYEQLRLDRTAKVQKGAWRNGKLFHLSNPLARLSAYGPIALASRLAPSKTAAPQDWLYSYDALNVSP